MYQSYLKYSQMTYATNTVIVRFKRFLFKKSLELLLLYYFKSCKTSLWPQPLKYKMYFLKDLVCILCPSFPYLTTFINLVYFSIALYVHSSNTGKLWTLFFAYSLKSLWNCIQMLSSFLSKVAQYSSVAE